MRRLVKCAVAAAWMMASGSAVAQTTDATRAFTRADTSALRKQLDAIANAHHGVMGYSVINLDTGE